MNKIKKFSRFILLLEERGSDIAVRTVVRDIINLFKSGLTGIFYLPQDRNTNFGEYKYFTGADEENESDEDEYDDEYDDEDQEISVKYDFPDFPIYFFVKVKLVQNRRIKRFRIDASAGLFDIDVTITYNPNVDMKPYWNEMSAELNVDVAHELEHLLQHYHGEFQDETSDYSSNLEYYMLPVEIPAQIAGFKRLYDLERKRGSVVTLDSLVRKWFDSNRYLSKLNSEDEEKIISNILSNFEKKYGYK
jgi:hypothetical protein